MPNRENSGFSDEEYNKLDDLRKRLIEDGWVWDNISGWCR